MSEDLMYWKLKVPHEVSMSFSCLIHFNIKPNSCIYKKQQQQHVGGEEQRLH